MFILLPIVLVFGIGTTVSEDYIVRGKPRSIRSTTTDHTYPAGNNQLRALIPKDYDILALPPTDNGSAAHVDFNVLVMGIWNVEESQELISVDLKLQIYWQDTRLSHLADPANKTFCILKPELLSYIWHPDIYIEKVKSINHLALMSKPSSLRIYPQSVVRYSARLTITVSCQMDFHYYPVDTQYCNVDLQNYSFNIKKIILGWKEHTAQLVPNVTLSNFKVQLHSATNFNVSSLSGDVYSAIRFTIVLRRRLSYHLIQTYLPSTIFILVSWLSFILPYESTSERMGYSMTCLFTLTSMFSAVRQSTPNVSYVKALDIWMVSCVMFVFLTLLQHAVISRIKRSSTFEKYVSEKVASLNNGSPRNKNKNNEEGIEETSFTRNSPRNSKECKNTLENNGTPNTEREDKMPTFQRIMKKTDRYLSCVIPFLFISFNIVYWSWLIFIKYHE